VKGFTIFIIMKTVKWWKRLGGY